MFDKLFPKHWTTLRKLLWLRMIAKRKDAEKKGEKGKDG